jgi:hypothetical protein
LSSSISNAVAVVIKNITSALIRASFIPNAVAVVVIDTVLLVSVELIVIPVVLTVFIVIRTVVVVVLTVIPVERTVVPAILSKHNGREHGN